jgi:hypothetical protein
MPDDIRFMPAVDRDLYCREFLCPTGREVYQLLNSDVKFASSGLLINTDLENLTTSS